jgi:hypothetical protein
MYPHKKHAPLLPNSRSTRWMLLHEPGVDLATQQPELQPSQNCRTFTTARAERLVYAAQGAHTHGRPQAYCTNKLRPHAHTWQPVLTTPKLTGRHHPAPLQASVNPDGIMHRVHHYWAYGHSHVLAYIKHNMSAALTSTAGVSDAASRLRQWPQS